MIGKAGLGTNTNETPRRPLAAAANRMVTQLAEVAALQQAQAAKEDIEATQELLRALNAQLGAVQGRCAAVGAKLTPVDRIEVKRLVTETVLALTKSKERFGSYRRQVQDLTSCASTVALLDQRLSLGWASYAQSTLSRSFALFDLVRVLPEVHDQVQTLAKLATSLRVASRTPPASLEDLALFEAKRSQFDRGLAAVDGLGDSVQSFLRSVLDGTATLATVIADRNVLDWCRQGNRAEAFLVTSAEADPEAAARV